MQGNRDESVFYVTHFYDMSIKIHFFHLRDNGVLTFLFYLNVYFE